MKRFLLINPFGIGDVLFTTPLIRALKEQIPDSTIAYWCNERVKELIAPDPYIDSVFALSRGDLKKIFGKSFFKGVGSLAGLWSGLRKARYDCAFDFSLDHRYGMLSALAGIKRRIGYDYKNRGRLLTDKVPCDGYQGKHVVEYYLELLRRIGIEAKDRNLRLYLSPDAKAKGRRILGACGINENDHLVIGMAPGAGGSWGRQASFKHWPSDRYAQLADRLMIEQGARVIILGEESEKLIAHRMIDAMHNKAIDLVGKTSVGELVSVMSNIHLLVTNDGGPLHIAVASGVRTVSIFGPVDEAVYGPYPPQKIHTVVTNDIECRPCYKKFRMEPCDNQRRCLEGIGLEPVIKAVQQNLADLKHS